MKPNTLLINLINYILIINSFNNYLINYNKVDWLLLRYRPETSFDVFV